MAKLLKFQSPDSNEKRTEAKIIDMHPIIKTIERIGNKVIITLHSEKDLADLFSSLFCFIFPPKINCPENGPLEIENEAVSPGQSIMALMEETGGNYWNKNEPKEKNSRGRNQGEIIVLEDISRCKHLRGLRQGLKDANPIGISVWEAKNLNYKKFYFQN